ncbi:hypothetical protein RJ640_017372 [Escallonia rubra]|uniref:Uncharacterized protein n=1 Tax=Escallonia rubra TaxID=112253 RepID=A0AA88QZN2_9ASTE|nr:hypothetical protein RJ640_017372 [Escallonia rubra]
MPAFGQRACEVCVSDGDGVEVLEVVEEDRGAAGVDGGAGEGEVGEVDEAAEEDAGSSRMRTSGGWRRGRGEAGRGGGGAVEEGEGGEGGEGLEGGGGKGEVAGAVGEAEGEKVAKQEEESQVVALWREGCKQGSLEVGMSRDWRALSCFGSRVEVVLVGGDLVRGEGCSVGEGAGEMVVGGVVRVVLLWVGGETEEVSRAEERRRRRRRERSVRCCTHNNTGLFTITCSPGGELVDGIVHLFDRICVAEVLGREAAAVVRQIASGAAQGQYSSVVVLKLEN